MKEATAWLAHISGYGSPKSCLAASSGGWGNGKLSSQAEQQYPQAATPLQPLASALATFTQQMQPKSPFSPAQAEPHAEAEANATHRLPVCRLGTKLCSSPGSVHPASLVSQLAPPCPKKARHPSQPRGTSRRAAGPVQKLTCLVRCHRAELVWGLTQS